MTLISHDDAYLKLKQEWLTYHDFESSAKVVYPRDYRDLMVDTLELYLRASHSLACQMLDTLLPVVEAYAKLKNVSRSEVSKAEVLQAYVDACDAAVAVRNSLPEGRAS